MSIAMAMAIAIAIEGQLLQAAADAALGVVKLTGVGRAAVVADVSSRLHDTCPR